MIRSISISDFRCFRHLEIPELGRMNLLVGQNNCGKTSVLEAMQLLSSGGDLYALVDILDRRGERFLERDTGPRSFRGFQVSHLFHNHVFEPGSRLALRSQQQGEDQWVELTIDDAPPEGDDAQGSLFDDGELTPPMSLILRGWLVAKGRRLPVSREGELSIEAVRRASRPNGTTLPNVRFVSSDSLSASDVIRLLEAVLLTFEEGLVIKALRTIEPDIQRIASIGSNVRTYALDRSSSARATVVVKCRGQKERMPIGILGDGIWRMLGLALSLVAARDGVLLVDEIDSGLHFSVMSDMWKLVHETASRLNVQVIATTHSKDCIESLATVCREQNLSGRDLTIQRIERGKETAVAFAEEEIVAAAERQIEIR